MPISPDFEAAELTCPGEPYRPTTELIRTMRPFFLRTIDLMTRLTVRKEPVRFVSSTDSKESSLMRSSSWSSVMPALAISTSMGPWASSAAAIAASRLSPSVTSAATVSAPSGPPSPDLLVTATWSPRRRNSSAIERPIPRLPPVIRTLRGCGVLSDIVDSLVDGACTGHGGWQGSHPRAITSVLYDTGRDDVGIRGGKPGPELRSSEGATRWRIASTLHRTGPSTTRPGRRPRGGSRIRPGARPPRAGTSGSTPTLPPSRPPRSRPSPVLSPPLQCPVLSPPLQWRLRRTSSRSPSLRLRPIRKRSRSRSPRLRPIRTWSIRSPSSPMTTRRGSSRPDHSTAIPPSSPRRTRPPTRTPPGSSPAAHKHRSPAMSPRPPRLDRKSTRLNSSHVAISYAVFCLTPPSPSSLPPLSLHDALPILEHPVPVVTDDDETRVVSTGPQHRDPAVEPEEDQAADEDATRIVPSRAQTPVAGDEPTATSSPERDEARAADTAEYPGPDLQADLAQQAPYETAQPAEPGAQQPAQGQPPAAPSPFETAAVEPEVGQPATSPGQSAPTQGYGEPAPGQGYDQASSDHGQGSPAYGPAAPAHGQRPLAHGQASPDYGPASPTYGQAPSYGQVSPAPSYGAPSPSPGHGQAPASPAPWSPAQGSPGMDSAAGWTASTGRAAETPQKGLVARFWWVGCIVLFLGAVLFAALIVLIILLSDGQGQAHGADPAEIGRAHV